MKLCFGFWQACGKVLGCGTDNTSAEKKSLQNMAQRANFTHCWIPVSKL